MSCTINGPDCPLGTENEEEMLSFTKSKLSAAQGYQISSHTRTAWTANVGPDCGSVHENSYTHGILSYQRRGDVIGIIRPNGDADTSCVTLIRNRSILNWRCPDNSVQLINEIQTNYPFLCRVVNAATPKDATCSARSDHVGNPCSVSTGNKFQQETDYAAPIGALKFQRIYNSLLSSQSASLPMGKGWTHNYQKRISVGQVIDAAWNVQPLAWTDPQAVVVIDRGNGSRVMATRDYTDSVIAGEGGWFIDRDLGLHLARNSNNTWTLTDVQSGNKEHYFSSGRLYRIESLNGQRLNFEYEGSSTKLISVTDSFGRKLLFGYNLAGQLSHVTLPNGQQLIYSYDSQNRLSSVTRPSSGTKTYHYSESTSTAPSGNPYLLTGITDEKGYRHADYAYDLQDRGVSTEHAGGAQKYTLIHGTSSTSVTDPYGLTSIYQKQTVSGSSRINEHSRSGVMPEQRQYDAAGNLSQTTIRGMTTRYAYDLTRNLEISRTEAVGTDQERTVKTEWHATLPVPIRMIELTKKNNPEDADDAYILRETLFTHDSRGNILTRVVIDKMTQTVMNGTPTYDTRTWTYTYNTLGQILTAKTPAGETTTYTYHPSNGNLLTITNPLGQITTYSGHNADGQPTQVMLPNGHQISYIYDDAGRLTRKVETIKNPTLDNPNGDTPNTFSWAQWLVDLIAAWCQALGIDTPLTANTTPAQNNYGTLNYSASQTATTRYEYDAIGQLVKVTLPDNDILEYGYDHAHRLTSLKDQYGNTTTYTLNSAGDITDTLSTDSNNTLKLKNKQVYDTLGRLYQEIGNNGQQVTYGYNSLEQITSITDSQNRQTINTYDGLDRLATVKDPLNGVVTYDYNALDQLYRVTDPRGKSTIYTPNAFGENIRELSPDTGLRTYTYTNGRLSRYVDSRNRTHAYWYDDAGRVTSRMDGSNRTLYSYDAGDYGKGSLTGMSNAETEVRFVHDSRGLVIEKQIGIKNDAPFRVRYQYSNGGKIFQMVMPSGKIVQYLYSSGKLTNLRMDGKQLINQVSYDPTGVSGWAWFGSTDRMSVVRDLDGRPASIISTNILNRNYGYNNIDHMTSIGDSAANISATYNQDELDRLTSQTINGIVFGYSYDANSNRTQQTKTENGLTSIVGYTIDPASNRIQSRQGTAYQYFNTGEVVSDGVRTYSYNAEGRSIRIQRGSVGIYNAYDPLGQRIRKTSGTAVTYFVYDEQGQLLGEYDQNRNMIREYLWMGDRLVGMMSAQIPNVVLRVHTDHLGTPRAVSQAATVLWRWEGDQFGDVLPNEDVDGNGIPFTMPIRHAGQYFDSEVGVFYNYFRDYDPATGRYVQSDPIGLQGGLNTYGYVGGNALGAVDPTGLLADGVTNACARNPVFCAETGIMPAPPISAGAAASATANLVGAAAGAAANLNECSDDCQPIINRIKAQTVVVRGRYFQLLQDQHGLFSRHNAIRNRHPNHGSWVGHLQQYRIQQGVLQSLITEAILKGCDPFIPADAKKWAREPEPRQPNRAEAARNGFF